MRTSAQQFEMLITFMEQHGDLTKPSSTAKGRISRLKDWDNLTSLLNSDGSGDNKSTQKWKKVWSDLKNNIKKKAARLHRAATATGGGPAVFAKLTDLEQRVLSLIGELVATGLPIDELGPEIIQNDHEDCTESEAATEISQSLLAQWNRPGPSYQEHVPPPTTHHHTPPTHFDVEAVLIEYDEDTNQVSQLLQPGPRMQPASSGQTPLSTPRRNIMVSPRGGIIVSPGRNIMVSPQRLTMVSPRRNILVSPRRRTTEATRRRRPNVSLGRRVISPRRPPVARADEAARQFVQSDEEWRQFRIEQNRQEMELRREQNRIREMEVETQRGWQSVAARALDLLDKLVSKYCGDSI